MTVMDRYSNVVVRALRVGVVRPTGHAVRAVPPPP